MKPWIYAATLLLAGGAMLAWWAFGKESGSAGSAASWSPPPPTVEIAAVRVGTVERRVQAVGTLRANESVTVRPEIAGRIAGIHFAEGERVSAGTPLVTLDDSVYVAERDESLAERKLAELAYQRADKLVKQGASPVETRDRALAQLQVSDAALALAEARLAKTRIAAPFDGIVGLRHVSPGEFVEVGQDLVSLVDIDPLKVDFRVGEIYLPAVATGQRISVRIDAFPEEVFTGEVYAIEPSIDVNGRALVIRASLPNPERRLRPGLFSRVDLIVDATADAILVPEDAIVPRGERHFVYRYQDGRAVLTEVVLGTRRGASVEIVRGLAPEARVVTAGQLKLRDGMAVTGAGGGE